MHSVLSFIWHIYFFAFRVYHIFRNLTRFYFSVTIGEKYEDPYYSFKVVMWYLKNNKWYNFLYVFMVKESAEIVIFVIKGQLLPQRSPKGHLRSFLVIFFGFSALFWYFEKFQTHFWWYICILHDLLFLKRYSYYVLDHSLILYEFS